jgi:hypothetical protein
MKIYSTAIHQDSQTRTRSGHGLIPAIAVSGGSVLAALGSLAAGSIVVLLSVLAAEAQITGVVGALTWGLGLIFFALAIDVPGRTSLLKLLTGVALCLLAWLQFNMSADFTVVSGVLVAAWAIFASLGRLR